MNNGCMSDSSSDDIVEVMYMDKSIKNNMINRNLPKHFTFDEDEIFLSTIKKPKKYIIKTHDIDIKLKLPSKIKKNLDIVFVD